MFQCKASVGGRERRDADFTAKAEELPILAADSTFFF